MNRRLSMLVVALLMVGTAAEAQGRGGGGGGGGGRGRGGGGGSQAPAPSTPATPSPPPAPEIPTNKSDLVGVVQGVGPGDDRVTITYEESDALNWPAGTMSFVVAKPALLKDVAAGQKVRFRIDSQQISYLAPY